MLLNYLVPLKIFFKKNLYEGIPILQIMQFSNFSTLISKLGTIKKFYNIDNMKYKILRLFFGSIKEL